MCGYDWTYYINVNKIIYSLVDAQTHNICKHTTKLHPCLTINTTCVDCSPTLQKDTLSQPIRLIPIFLSKDVLESEFHEILYSMGTLKIFFYNYI